MTVTFVFLHRRNLKASLLFFHMEAMCVCVTRL